MTVQTHFFGDDCLPAHEAKAVLTKAMSEESLLQAVTDALTLHHWLWSHPRRSDRALMMGNPGVPDIIAAKKGRLLFLELKRQDGKLTESQLWWSRALFPNWYVIRPADLDWLLEKLV